MNKTNLPNNLYELRRRANLSQEDFAEKLGVSRQAVSKWERGEAYPDTDNLITISGMFGVTIDELLNSDDIQSAAPSSDTESETDGSKAEDSTEEASDGSFRLNIGDRVINLNGAISVDKDDSKVKIDLDNGNIIVDDDEDHVTVNLGNAGISVNSDDGVKI